MNTNFQQREGRGLRVEEQRECEKDKEKGREIPWGNQKVFDIFRKGFRGVESIVDRQMNRWMDGWRNKYILKE